MQESSVIPHRPEPTPGETKPGPEIQIIPPKKLDTPEPSQTKPKDE